MVLIQSWVLGEKYDTSECMDEVMLALLSACQYGEVDPETVKAAVEGAAPAFKLRQLMCNEIIYTVYFAENRTMENFEESLAAFGFSSEVLAALNEYHLNGKRSQKNYVSRSLNRQRPQTWREFMVAGEPHQHWIFGPVGDGVGETMGNVTGGVQSRGEDEDEILDDEEEGEKEDEYCNREPCACA